MGGTVRRRWSAIYGGWERLSKCWYGVFICLGIFVYKAPAYTEDKVLMKMSSLSFELVFYIYERSYSDRGYFNECMVCFTNLVKDLTGRKVCMFKKHFGPIFVQSEVLAFK